MVPSPAPLALPPMVTVPAVTTFWTLPSVRLEKPVARLVLFCEIVMEPAAPMFRLTNVRAERLRSVVEIRRSALPPRPITRV